MKKVILLISIMILLCSCGKNELDENEIFKNDLEQFYTNVNNTSESMNNIDTTDPYYIETMLSYLDDMDSYFKTLNKINVPDEYKDISPKLTNAATYMDQAVILYHQSYEAEVMDKDLAYTAKSYYDSAMECIHELGAMLMDNNKDTSTDN